MTLFVILLAWLLLSIYTIEDRKGANIGFPFLWTIILIGVLHFFFTLDLPQFTAAEWVVIIVLYFTIGVVWSFVRWVILNKRIYNYVVDSIVFKTQSHPGMTQQEFLKDKAPKVRDHISSLAAWILWWPFSVLHYLLGTLIVDVVEWIVKLFTRCYESITNKIFKL